MFRAVICLSVFVLCAGCDTTPRYEEGHRSINGVHLFCKAIGRGEPIVVVHGGPGMDHTYFLPQLKELAETHRVIFFDQRASGRSSSNIDPESVNLDAFIRDIDGVLRSYGIEKANLMGHSWGGLLAAVYAARRPESMRSLMVVEPSPASSEIQGRAQPRLTKEDEAARDAILASESFANGEPSAYEDLFRVFFGPGFHDRTKVAELTLTFPSSFRDQSRLLQQGLGKDFASYDFHDELAAVKCPTLIVAGDASDNLVEGTQAIHRAIGGSMLVEMGDCGHFPFVEQPEEFFAIVREFLDSVED